MNDQPPRQIAPVAFSPESTVVAEFDSKFSSDTTYQSEAQLEKSFIECLKSQCYEYIPLHGEDHLIQNLRKQLERLNKYEFTENEWKSFFTSCISSSNDGITDKTRRIQEDHIQVLRRDDGTSKNIMLIDKVNIHNNSLQVINQYEVEGDSSEGLRSNRYDVTILVNGIPMVHVELKRRGVAIREAFNQIDRYQRDSFWAGSGLFEYVQLFVISNGTDTKYYSNTTRNQRIEETTKKTKGKKASNSFEFTSHWADANNKPTGDLEAFARTFFARHSILNILTKYCVFTSDALLLVMRPYQIVATERIITRINIATNMRQLGTTAAGGYIWHTTGSGKTLTSFKTAQLATAIPEVQKVLFVVDRRDLDYQTMTEYDKFQKGAANSNTSTAILKKQLEDSSVSIIVTTIQKLSNFVSQNKGHDIYNQHTVIIFDECHRSQFGDMHQAITKCFKRYHLFGFTGTPIFPSNASSGGNPKLRTTEQAFGDKLHTYTIVDAISDHNVLPFRIDYIDTVKRSESVIDKQVSAIDTERVLMDPRRIKMVTEYILEHFDQKTRRSEVYQQDGKRMNGFNALFATSSIDAPRMYYNSFHMLQESLVPEKRLKVGLIYSYVTNEEVQDVFLDEEGFDTNSLSMDARSFLDDAIRDYNDMFGTNYDTTSGFFDNYYRDLTKRIKNREIDLVIVVNMFLTGFDATTLNTLFVDKNLRSHGLLQAYSRTNRILNSVKTYGNIVSFRNLEQETNDAIALFGNKEAGGVVLLKPFGDYYGDYEKQVQELLHRFPLGVPIIGESAQKDFISLFGAILKLVNILVSFDEFEDKELLSERQSQDYRSVYLDLYGERRRREESEKERFNDDVVFEIELVKQVEINVDYILMNVDEYKKQLGNGKDIEIRASIERAVDASPSLRSKKDLIQAFIESITSEGNTEEQWRQFISARCSEELRDIIRDENLKPNETQKFVEAAFRDGVLRTTGTAIAAVLPPVSKFSPGAQHSSMKQRVVGKLNSFFDRFFGMTHHDDLKIRD